MNVLRLFDVGKIRNMNEEMPVPLAGEALIKVTAVGICGSDLHWFAEGSTGEGSIEPPFVLGHEFAGIVQSGSMAGQLVAVDPHVPCGRCEFCLEGNPNLCADHYFAGQAPQDGALQEYLAWPEENLFVLPASLSEVDGAMLEPLGVAIHTVDLGKLKPGMTVGVFGCGPIGLLVIQLARLSGAVEIFATDLHQHRLDAASTFGATKTLLANNAREAQEILVETKGRGLDVVFEAAGSNDAVEASIEAVKPGGRVVLCGIPSVNQTSFKASTARRKGLTIMMVRRMKHTYLRAIALVHSGQVDVRSVVSHRLPLVEYEQAFEIANSRAGLKVIVQP